MAADATHALLTAAGFNFRFPGKGPVRNAAYPRELCCAAHVHGTAFIRCMDREDGDRFEH